MKEKIIQFIELLNDTKCNTNNNKYKEKTDLYTMKYENLL